MTPRFYITSPYSTDPIPVTLTDDIYYASLPTAVQALRTSSSPFALAQQLAKAGYFIDVPIMVYGLDPVACMCQRVYDGYTWVPSALMQNIPLGPGIAWPGTPYDPNNPPIGAIKVSVNAADYPPFNPPVPVAPATPGTNIVGAEDKSNPGHYFPGPAAMINSLTPAVTDGQQVRQGAQNFTAHVTMGLMGYSMYFTSNQ